MSRWPPSSASPASPFGFTTTDRTVTYLSEVTYRGDVVRIDMDLPP
jgi:hypothetical protein